MINALNTYDCPVGSSARIHSDQVAALDGTSGEVWTYARLNRAIQEAADVLASNSERLVVVQEWNSIPLIIKLFAAWRSDRFVVLLSPRIPHTTTQKIQSRLQSIIVGGAHQNLPLDWATGMLTSGSTGEPKLIVHSRHNHSTSAAACIRKLNLSPGDVWLWSLPVFHVGGLSILWRCFSAGSTVRFAPRGFQLEHILSDSDVKEGAQGMSLPNLAPPTILSLVPTQLNELVNNEVTCPPSVRSVIVGGAPSSTSLITEAIKLGYPIHTTYGLTETSSMVTLSDRWITSSDTVHAGKPLHGVHLSFSETGQITVQSEAVRVAEINIFSDQAAFQQTRGSHTLPSENHEARGIPEYRTQDRGRLNALGNLEIGARLDDVIISGGENISLERIKNTILIHPAVQDCRVIAQPHASYGFRPIAFVKWKSEVGPEFESLTHFLESNLDKIACPDFILQLPDPEDGALKVTLEQLQTIAQSHPQK